MTIDFYYVPGSAPCRAAMLVAKAYGVELNLKYTNLMEGAHMKPEFLAMNPQHSVPTIDDNGFYLYESRAICCYFANQYGKDDSLYPKDPKKRALVDARLYFDSGTIFNRFTDYYYPFMFAGIPYDANKLKKLEEAYDLFNKFLEGQTWVAGPNMTIADITLASTVSTAEVVGFDVKKYHNVQKWFENAKKTIPGYDEINQYGVEKFKELFDHLTKSK